MTVSLHQPGPEGPPVSPALATPLSHSLPAGLSPLQTESLKGREPDFSLLHCGPTHVLFVLAGLEKRKESKPPFFGKQNYLGPGCFLFFSLVFITS